MQVVLLNWKIVVKYYSIMFGKNWPDSLLYRRMKKQTQQPSFIFYILKNCFRIYYTIFYNLTNNTTIIFLDGFWAQIHSPNRESDWQLEGAAVVGIDYSKFNSVVCNGTTDLERNSILIKRNQCLKKRNAVKVIHRVLLFKGAVSRDFLPLFFFMNQIHLGPW